MEDQRPTKEFEIRGSTETRDSVTKSLEHPGSRRTLSGSWEQFLCIKVGGVLDISVLKIPIDS